MPKDPQHWALLLLSLLSFVLFCLVSILMQLLVVFAVAPDVAVVVAIGVGVLEEVQPVLWYTLRVRGDRR